MGLFDFLNKQESLIGLDIGATSLKLVEIDLSAGRPRLVNVGVTPLGGDIFSGNAITGVERVAEQVGQLLESNGINDKRVVTAVPSPSVFTKRIKMPKQDPAELRDSVYLEAGNFIPHKIDAVKLDFHVIGESAKGQLDVLVVAVKNEILDSYIDCLALAGLETAVVDVDYFAMQNIFELCYPELQDKTIGLINIGARYSSINICRNGDSLFTGDMSVGGKVFTDAIAEGLGIPAIQAEALKRKCEATDPNHDSVQDILDRNIEFMANEFNRQLSFFWSAAGTDEAIDSLMVTGGGSQIPGLLEELAQKTSLPCQRLDPLRGLECGEAFDAAYLKEISPSISIALGLGLRQTGDKIMPDIY